MCTHVDESGMLVWLHKQVRIIEAWREELACHPEIDIPTVERLERHYSWLTSEIDRLETSSRPTN